MNPFTEGSTQYKDFEVMSDCKWHCSKCELLSGQAKTWQVWRQEKGIQLDQDEEGHWYKKILCPKCGVKTIHRKLKSTEIIDTDLKARTGIPPEIAKRAKALYGCVDEYNTSGYSFQFYDEIRVFDMGNQKQATGTEILR